MAAFAKLVLFMIFIAVPTTSSTRITFSDNGYDGVVVAIHPDVPEDPNLIESLKSLWMNASEILFEATRKRAFFRSIKIVVPASWTNGTYDFSTRGESYSSADVIVANPNPISGDLPYTLQFGDCGQPGQYIHLTPNYVKDDVFESDNGVKGKVIVHEWAHLRWGVFDEAPTLGYPEFYLSNKNVEATRCSSSLSGMNAMIDYNTWSIAPCTLDSTTFMPEPGCVFIPLSTQPNGLSSSIMSHQYINGITTFCHSNASDPVNLHNEAAPNEHNRLCNLRSTWDVILGSDDFIRGNVFPNDALVNTTPIITVVKPQPPRYVLVMDVSGSMAGNRLTVMQRAAGLFVTDFVSDSSYVGLVSFSSTGRKLSDLRTMDGGSRNDLNGIIMALAATGSTGIGSGILKGLEVLKGSSGEYGCGGNLIVLTDGEENQSPYVRDVYDDVLACGARMYTIFLDLNTVTANQIMTNLSLASGGGWFLSNSSTSSTDIISNFQTLSQSDDGNNTEKTYQIHSFSYSSVASTAVINGAVKIDSTIGNHTLFTFTWGSGTIAPEITLDSPSGCQYKSSGTSATACPDDPVHQCDTTFRSCKFSIPGTAMPGSWTYSVTVAGSIPQDITVTVTSRPSSIDVTPIEVVSYLATTDITSATSTAVYARVSKGFSPVLGANVTAVVATPSGNEVQLQLYDNGAGPDVRKNDGIYSRYFYQYTTPGRYSLRIIVGGSSGQVPVTGSPHSPAAFNLGVISDNGTFVPNPNGLSHLPNATEASVAIIVEDFERISSGGSFSYSGPAVTAADDFFGPNRITDLRATQFNIANLEDILISVTFTAPGDDLDSGTASTYEIKYSFFNATFLLDNFNDSTTVNQSDIIAGDLTTPQAASSEETFVFKIQNRSENVTALPVYVAIQAYDEVGNPSGVSNIAPVTLLLTRSALPSVSSSTTTTTSTDTESTSPQNSGLSTNSNEFLPYRIGLVVLGLLTALIVSLLDL